MHVTQLTTRAHALIADNCRYETPCIRSYGVGEPIKKVSQKSAEYIGVNSLLRPSCTKIAKSSKKFTFSDFHDFFYVDIFSRFF